MNYIIIVAGGNGQRTGLKYNKIYVQINRHPLIYWTIKACEQSETIDKIIISVKKEEFLRVNKLIKKYNFKKVIKIIEANHSRQDSTFIALKWLKTIVNDSDLVGVHNGVNPFVKKIELDNVYKTAKEYGTSLLAYPAKDTVKIIDNQGMVIQTPIRKNCWYAQTPQVASFGSLWQAFVSADKDRFLGTDDTQLLERIGIRPKIVECSGQNFKITFPEDIILARKIIKNFLKNNV